MKGGYQIFDLKGKVFTSGTGAVVSGARKVVDGCNGKPVLVEHLKVGSTSYSAFMVSFPPAAADASATGKGMAGSSTVTIAVAANDTVTVTVS